MNTADMLYQGVMVTVGLFFTAAVCVAVGTFSVMLMYAWQDRYGDREVIVQRLRDFCAEDRRAALTGRRADDGYHTYTTVDEHERKAA
jgi:hypothetical protein